jgi:hypothetical protein
MFLIMLDGLGLGAWGWASAGSASQISTEVRTGVLSHFYSVICDDGDADLFFLQGREASTWMFIVGDDCLRRD